MSYKIVVDSCCELPEIYKNDPRFVIVPLTLEVGEYHIMDDEGFNQAEFLAKVAECPECPRSACPSPNSYMEACRGEEEHVYIVTLSSKLSGSYNSAMLAKELYEDTYGEKQIHVVDSESASVGETQIVERLIALEKKGYPFETIVEKIERFRSSIRTFFVLDNIETLRKNGRLSGLKALAATALNIKPFLAGDKGAIVQRGQGIGMKKALAKLADTVVEEIKEKGASCTLMISHCGVPERAEAVKKMILDRLEAAKMEIAKIEIFDMRGVSSMYANAGGIIVTF